MTAKYEVRTPDAVFESVRSLVASHTSVKKSHVTMQTRLTKLEGDGIFDVVDALEETYGIETPDDDTIASWTKNNVRMLVEFVITAQLKKLKPKKAGANKGKKIAQDPDKKPSGKKVKYPELATSVRLNIEGLAAVIVDRAGDRMKSSKSVVLTYCDDEIQCRDPKTDALIGIVKIITNHYQVGFNLIHFQYMGDTLADAVNMFSFTLGTPHTLRTRYEMACRMRIEGRPDTLDSWIVDTLANRVMFFPAVAPLLKKLVGEPKAGHVHIVSEIASLVGAEFEDDIFDVYTNINKMEAGDEEAVEDSLNDFFTNMYEDVESEANSRPKKCKPVVSAPTATPDDEEEDEPVDYAKVDRALNDALDDFRHFDLLNGVPAKHLVDLFIHTYDEHTYKHLLLENLPVSQARSKMIDTLVNDHTINDMASIARRSKLAHLINIGEMLKVNVV